MSLAFQYVICGSELMYQIVAFTFRINNFYINVLHNCIGYWVCGLEQLSNWCQTDM